MSGFMILCGFVKLKIFYSAFNVNIVDYQNLGETLTSFMGDIIYYSIMIFVGYFVSFLIKPKEAAEQQAEQEKNILLTEGFFKRVGKHLIRLKPVIVLLAISGVFNVVQFNINEEVFVHSGVFFSSLLIMLVFTILKEEYRRQYIIHYNIDINPSVFNIILTALLFVFFTIKYSYAEIHEVQHHKKYFGVEIITSDNNTIISDSTVYFIGMTKDFIFIHDEKLNETHALNRSDVKEIVYR